MLINESGSKVTRTKLIKPQTKEIRYIHIVPYIRSQGTEE